MIPPSLGLTHRAGLDQIVDRGAIVSCLRQHGIAVLPDIGRGWQFVLGETGDAGRARAVDRAPTPGVSWQTAALVASTWTLRSHSPGSRIRSAMISAACNRESQASVGWVRNTSRNSDISASAASARAAKSANLGSLARSSRAIAAHSRLYCGSLTSVTIIQPS